MDGHTEKVISIHHCLFLLDSKRAVTDEGDTIRDETAKHGRKKKAWKESGCPQCGNMKDQVGTSAFKGHDKD